MFMMTRLLSLLVALPPVFVTATDMMGPSYPVERTTELVKRLSRLPYVSPTSSSKNGSYVVNMTPGSVKGDYGLRDPQVPPLPQYGMRISDDSDSRKKTTVVVMGGTHAREQAGSHMLEGFLRKLVEDSPEMRDLRKRVEVFVYPQVNPEGRYAYLLPGNPHGIERDAPSNLGKGAYDEDLNRIWHQPEGWPQIMAIQKVIREDTEGKAELFFDFHARSFTRKNLENRKPPQHAKEVWVTGENARCVYIEYLTKRDPGIQVVEKKARELPQTGSAWAASEQGLNARFAFIPECARDEPVDFYHKLGEVYALALYDFMNAPLP